MASQSYTVKSGDTLWAIAEQFYGDGSEWNKIYDANRDAIGDDPDNVAEGTELTIP